MTKVIVLRGGECVASFSLLLHHCANALPAAQNDHFCHPSVSLLLSSKAFYRTPQQAQQPYLQPVEQAD